MSQPSAVRFTPCRSVCNCPPSVSPEKLCARRTHVIMSPVVLFVGASCPCETTGTWRAEAPALPCGLMTADSCTPTVWWVSGGFSPGSLPWGPTAGPYPSSARLPGENTGASSSPWGLAVRGGWSPDPVPPAPLAWRA